MADDIKHWAEAGQLHEIILRLRLGETTELDKLRFELNGWELPQASCRRINALYTMSNIPRYRVNNAYWYIFKLAAHPAHWPVAGTNTVVVTLLSRDGGLAVGSAAPDEIAYNSYNLHLRDVELDIQYLKGKAWHRGQDPDLGPAVDIRRSML